MLIVSSRRPTTDSRRPAGGGSDVPGRRREPRADAVNLAESRLRRCRGIPESPDGQNLSRPDNKLDRRRARIVLPLYVHNHVLDLRGLFMAHHEVEKRRRLFILWIVAVVICAAAVLTEALIAPLHLRLAGLEVSSMAAAAKYVSAAAVCLATFRWFLTAPRGNRRITVMELRGRATVRVSPPRPQDPAATRSA